MCPPSAPQAHVSTLPGKPGLYMESLCFVQFATRPWQCAQRQLSSSYSPPPPSADPSVASTVTVDLYCPSEWKPPSFWEQGWAHWHPGGRVQVQQQTVKCRGRDAAAVHGRVTRGSVASEDAHLLVNSEQVSESGAGPFVCKEFSPIPPRCWSPAPRGTVI